MKQLVYGAMLLAAMPALADEKAKLAEICDISWAAYNNQDINLLRPFLELKIEKRTPADWTAEQKTAALEGLLENIVNKHQGYWAKYGHVSYEITRIRILDKADIPRQYSSYPIERYARITYLGYSTDTPTKRISTGCTFFDLDGNGSWMLDTPAIAM
ncbi:hypothetical protein [Alkalimonas mucilaginosa]|uniref:Uncharacterized protein n=1 Tax=Alkalimonas mucilaginosa TaxID=3057676 RepID=A0ABU7JJV4_9GAMM|nr:hypothetical protein [Alkalimonas sp. MEB004]MEE2025775.1 hypothetical protein [Alkalimonas sp. MEB004]